MVGVVGLLVFSLCVRVCVHVRVYVRHIRKIVFPVFLSFEMNLAPCSCSRLSNVLYQALNCKNPVSLSMLILSKSKLLLHLCSGFISPAIDGTWEVTTRTDSDAE